MVPRIFNEVVEEGSMGDMIVGAVLKNVDESRRSNRLEVIGGGGREDVLPANDGDPDVGGVSPGATVVGPPLGAVWLNEFIEPFDVDGVCWRSLGSGWGAPEHSEPFSIFRADCRGTRGA